MTVHSGLCRLNDCKRGARKFGSDLVEGVSLVPIDLRRTRSLKSRRSGIRRQGENADRILFLLTSG